MLEKIKLLLSKEETTNVFKKNLVKEYLQIPILSFFYSNKKYQDLIFYGGSCLKHCFDLPRLSEDLDFVNKVLEEGKEKARTTASIKLAEAKRAIGVL